MCYEKRDSEQAKACFERDQRKVEYINREALKQHLMSYAGMFTDDLGFAVSLQAVLNGIDFQPAADVAPVVHGKWVAKNGRIVCDHCEALIAVCTNRDVSEENLKFFRENDKFCYNCGADMKDGD